MITEIVSYQHKDLLDVRWALSNLCNYKCKYCFPGSNEGNYPFPKDIDLLVKNFTNVFDFYKNIGRSRFHLELLGGEPTMWSGLEEFIRRIKEKHNVYLTMVTNGSRTLRYWQDNGMLFDNIALSFHYGQADVNHFISVADTLYEYGKKVTVRMLMDPEHWNECISVVGAMEDSRYPWIIQTKEIIPTLYVPTYTEEQRKYIKQELKRIPDKSWFMKQRKLIRQGFLKPFESYYIEDGIKHDATANHLLNTGKIYFKDYMCNMGVESIYINYDGKIMSSCGQKLFDDRFNIFDHSLDFNHNNEPVKCTINSCMCSFETNVGKVIYLQPVK